MSDERTAEREVHEGKEIFTAVLHDEKIYCLECFLNSGGNIEEAQSLDMGWWDSKSPPKCSLCFQEHTNYIKTY